MPLQIDNDSLLIDPLRWLLTPAIQRLSWTQVPVAWNGVC